MPTWKILIIGIPEGSENERGLKGVHVEEGVICLGMPSSYCDNLFGWGLRKSKLGICPKLRICETFDSFSVSSTNRMLYI